MTLFKISVRFISVLLISALPHSAWAQENPMGNPQWLVMQTLLGLALVVGFIFVLAWVAKKLNLTQLGQHKQFHVVASLNLSAREKAVVIQIGEHQALLGVAPGNVRQLHLFTDPIIDPQSIGGNKKTLSASSANEFSKKLNEFLSHGNKT